jgi:hypothetical protein
MRCRTAADTSAAEATCPAATASCAQRSAALMLSAWLRASGARRALRLHGWLVGCLDEWRTHTDRRVA